MLENCLYHLRALKHTHIFGSRKAPNNQSIIYHPGTKHKLHPLNALYGTTF